jgi:exonuclease 1
LYLVFLSSLFSFLDGGYLPAKKGKELERRTSRMKYQEEGTTLLRNGNIKAANDCFKKAVDVSPVMAKELMKKLDEMKVEYIVAPYEADAQLSFLCKTNYVHAIITEDSDLIAYECPRVFLKMDKYGNGEEIQLKNIGLNEELNFIHFNHDMFIRMCVLSGCDYLDSLQGIGIVNAYKIVRDYKTLDGIFEQLEKVVTLPKDYKKDFLKAELTFKHQRVFDVLNRKMVPLNPLPQEISEEPLSFLGPLLSSSVYLSICTGKMDPITMKYFDEEKSSRSSVVSKTSPFMNQSTLKIGISKKQSINTLLIKKYLKSDEESLTSFDSQKSSFDSQNKESGSEGSEEGEESEPEESEQESEYEEQESEHEEQEKSETEEQQESEPQKEQIEISDDSDQEKKKRKHETIINLTNEKRDLFDMIYKKKKINK